MATRKDASPFGKPKSRAGGQFQFQMPETLGSGRGRIPEGKYIGRLTDIAADVSKNSGNNMWVWTFVITKGKEAGRDFKLWTALTDNAAWKIAETMKALGVEVEAGDNLTIDKKQLIGTGVTMHIKDDAGQNGDGEFSKLDKISAHPNGAGYKPGKGPALEEDDEEEEFEDEDNEEDSDEEDTDEEDSDEDEYDDNEDFNGDDEDSEEEDVDDEPPVKRSAKKAPAKKAPAKKAVTKGKAPATLGKKKR